MASTVEVLSIHGSKTFLIAPRKLKLSSDSQNTSQRHRANLKRYRLAIIWSRIISWF